MFGAFNVLKPTQAFSTLSGPNLAAQLRAILRRQSGTQLDIDPAYCFQDSAGTVPAAVGDPVGAVVGRDGVYTATQTTAEDRPTLRQDANGKYYLEHAAGQSLSVTLPDLGTDASAYYATDAGVTTLADQTISGAYTLPSASRIYGWLVFDGALTAREGAAVVRYLERRAGLTTISIPLAALITQDGLPLVTQDGNYLIAEAA